MKYRYHLEGQRFGRLVVVSRGTPSGYHQSWICRCDCGIEKRILQTSLLRGLTKSCGCLRAATTTACKTIHGHTVGAKRSRAHAIWSGMLRRCFNEKNPAFKDYGARGITVCEEWLAFENFLRDMGEPPPGLTLDRIDNDKDYRPGNCRWASKKEQANNRRSNRILSLDGTTLNLSQWAKKYGISRGILSRRLDQGWDLRAALSAPPYQSRHSKRTNGSTASEH